MKRSFNILLLLLPLLAFGLVAMDGCRRGCDDCPKPPPIVPKPDKGPVELTLVHKMGNAALEFEPKLYTNAAGEEFNVKTFKYYIGNFSLTREDGATYALSGPQYYLADAKDPNSLLLKFDSLPNGRYTQLRFSIGVDSVNNNTLNHTGALDPANNMYWSWNTGYVFVRWSGFYKSLTDTIRGYAIDLGLNSNFSYVGVSSNFEIAGAQKKLNLEFDLDELLKGPYTYGFDKDADQIHTNMADQQTYGGKLVLNMKDAFRVAAP